MNDTPRLPTWRYDPDRGAEFPYCPVCDGRTEISFGGSLVCVEYGTEHYYVNDYRPVYEAHFAKGAS